MSGVLDTLKSLVSGAAPLLANAILPGSGGFAKSLIGKVFGIDPSDEAGLVTAMQNATPEQVIALQNAEMKHETDLARISADLDIEHLKDRQDARKNNTQLQLAGHHNYRADLMLAMAFGCLCYLLYIFNTADDIKPEVLAIYNMISGALLGAILDAFRFEFGSSRGSKEKDLK